MLLIVLSSGLEIVLAVNSGFPRSGKVENFVKAFPDQKKVGKSAC